MCSAKGIVQGMILTFSREVVGSNTDFCSQTREKINTDTEEDGEVAATTEKTGTGAPSSS